MRSRIVAIAAVVVLAYGCASTAPVPATPPQNLYGIASWYGEEFAGRTTANGEIFDPSSLTAAHRTLPFGTVLDITNPKTIQTVRVRVNDRGPYIGNRIIDLSYAAAQKIGLIEPGIGEVEIKVVRLGSGEREPPAPFEATIAEAPRIAPAPEPPRTGSEPPPVAFPLPSEPAVVERVDVITERGGVVTRKQVSVDGRTIEDVPVEGGEAPTANALDTRARETRAAQARRVPQFLVQVGAFAVEENAKLLQEKLATIGHRAFIDRAALYRVRLGPFATREQAADARAALEANGLSAMIVSE